MPVALSKNERLLFIQKRESSDRERKPEQNKREFDTKPVAHGILKRDAEGDANIVSTHPTHFLQQPNKTAHRIMILCVSLKPYRYDSNRLSEGNFDFFVSK